MRGIIKLEFDIEHGRRWHRDPEHGLVTRFRNGHVRYVAYVIA